MEQWHECYIVTLFTPFATDIFRFLISKHFELEALTLPAHRTLYFRYNFEACYFSISIFSYFIPPLHYLHFISLVTSYFADSDYAVLIGCYSSDSVEEEKECYIRAKILQF